MTDPRALSAVALKKAAEELRGFMAFFKTLHVVAEALEEAGGLEGRILQAQREAAEIVGTARSDAEKLRGDIEALTETRDTLRAEVTSARNELAALREQVSERRATLDAIQKKIADIVNRVG